MKAGMRTRSRGLKRERRPIRGGTQGNFFRAEEEEGGREERTLDKNYSCENGRRKTLRYEAGKKGGFVVEAEGGKMGRKGRYGKALFRREGNAR